MSDDSNKTEQPTGKRLNKAVEGGNVPQSMEMMSAISIISLTATSYFFGPGVIKWATEGMREAFSCQTYHATEPQLFMQYFTDKGIEAAAVMTPFFLVLTISGISTSIAIGGFKFSTKKLKLNFSALLPQNAIKQLFSPQSFVKLILSVIKLILIGTIVYAYLKDRIEVLATFQWVWSLGLLTAISKLILGVLVRLSIGLLIIGFADLFFQKYNRMKKLMMSKQEIKDEQRNAEGSPEVKRHIRKMQFQAVMQRMLQDVPKANVVLVNPTHYAVALRYDPNTMGSPEVVAKGADHMCEKIKEVARAYGVPIIRRPAMARKLYANVELGQPIPESLFVAVAEIMALIHRLRHNR